MTELAPPKIELRIPCAAEYVGVARLAVSAVASRMNFGVDAVDDLKLAVGEACANAIQHAAEGEISITCVVEPDRLVVTVKDCGVGFDPATARARPVEELPDGGLGLMLIEALMDEFQIESDPQRGTEVRMVKRLQK
jgi:serine/threonine-protein kinase RsbW